MDETNRVLARLRRIEELRAGAGLREGAELREGAQLREGAELPKGTQASVLLDELRALVPEAEAWARAEGDARARIAATKLREEAEGMR